MTDSELIGKFLTGDVNAFNTLVWRWEKSVYNFILRYIGDREESQDICQKTFIRVYRKLNRLRDTEKFSTWLYQIAINICRDEIKSRSRRKTYSLDHLQENSNGAQAGVLNLTTDSKSEPEEQAHKRDVSDLIGRALQTLPEEQRVVIIMKEYQGLKFTEIADILETSVNTAKSRMYYGIAALRKIFMQWEISKESLRYEM
ncbi:sigma-70 family RNA polymerase sigma factor [candidate division KSB1 bacterium]|nr:sigma-70 family RNA polymerase sigma factor [candidate division KSB1 bacterium]